MFGRENERNETLEELTAIHESLSFKSSECQCMASYVFLVLSDTDADLGTNCTQNGWLVAMHLATHADEITPRRF